MKFKILNEAKLWDINPDTGFPYTLDELEKINAID